MDPASLSLAIVGVLPLVAKTIGACREYINDVKGAKATVNSLITELEALHSTLDSLASLLKEDAARHGIVCFESSSALVTCTDSCRAKMTALCVKLQHHINRDNAALRALVWPLQKAEHKETIAELRGYTSCMQFALSIDNCRLLAGTAEDVLAAIGRQQESFDKVRQAVEGYSRDLDGHARMLRNDKQAEAREKLLDWVATGAPAQVHSQRHSALQMSRAEGTGGWLLERDEFAAWRDGTASSGVLWCHGIQGSGKTNLTSIVIDNLLTDKSAKIAYFYFDHQETSSQTPLAVWTSILRQYLQHLPEIPRCVEELYERSRKSGDSLPLHECQRVLLELVNDVGPTSPLYLVLDALDECDASGGRRREVLKFLGRLINSPSLRVLVTSRPHVQDIVAVLDKYPKLEIEAQEEDLRTYLSQEVDNGGIYDIADEEFVNSLIDTLAERAQGMFLLPVLQLRTVLQEPTLGAMEDALADLSHSLAGAFEETIRRIQRLPTGRSRLGMGSLLYIVHSKRPMTSAELSDALAIQDDDTDQREVRPKYRPVSKTILDCCQGLVMIDKDTDHVKIAHYAIQEYLVTNADLFPAAPAKMTMSCIRYLLFDTFKGGPWIGERSIHEMITANPFLVYASENWGEHARDVNTRDDETTLSALTALLENQAALAFSIQIHRYVDGYRESYWDPLECLSYTSLHAACRYGLTHCVERLLEQGTYDVNQGTKMGTTPIIMAASSSYMFTMSLLLDHGANPRLANWYGDALNCAVEASEVESTRELVRWGMDPNGQQPGSTGKFRSPMDCVLDRDSADAMEALVELGAELSDDEWFYMARMAIFWGKPRVLGLMLRKRWVSILMHDATFQNYSLLHYAASTRDHRVLEMLLAVEGAAEAVNACDNNGSTPLDVAYAYRNRVAIQILEAEGGERKVEARPNSTVFEVADDVESTGGELSPGTSTLGPPELPTDAQSSELGPSAESHAGDSKREDLDGESLRAEDSEGKDTIRTVPSDAFKAESTGDSKPEEDTVQTKSNDATEATSASGSKGMGESSGFAQIKRKIRDSWLRNRNVKKEIAAEGTLPLGLSKAREEELAFIQRLKAGPRRSNNPEEEARRAARMDIN